MKCHICEREKEIVVELPVKIASKFSKTHDLGTKVTTETTYNYLLDFPIWICDDCWELRIPEIANDRLQSAREFLYQCLFGSVVAVIAYVFLKWTILIGLAIVLPISAALSIFLQKNRNRKFLERKSILDYTPLDVFNGFNDIKGLPFLLGYVVRRCAGKLNPNVYGVEDTKERKLYPVENLGETLNTWQVKQLKERFTKELEKNDHKYLEFAASSPVRDETPPPNISPLRFYYRGIALEKLGNKRQALIYFQNAHLMEPNNEDYCQSAMRLMSELYSDHLIGVSNTQ